jgi:hypothetical protein
MSTFRFLSLLLFVLFVTLQSKAQDNYEIQVYASPTVGKDTTMVELHSNYSFKGNPASEGVVSTNHMLRETIEITHGWTPWFETGFYIFNAFGDMGRTNYVGSHIRPRVMAPAQWNWPVGVSILDAGGPADRRQTVRPSLSGVKSGGGFHVQGR